MSQEPPTKKVRKGTRSCLECKTCIDMCRHRKVRCIWPSEVAEICQNCSNRDRKCEVQVQMIATSDTVKVTSRARITHLENDVSSLRKAVCSLEAKIGCPTSTSQTPTASHSFRARTTSPSVDADVDEENDSSSDASESSPPNLPTHILQLFDNGVLGSHARKSHTSSRNAPGVHKGHASSTLLDLLPSRDDMLIISAHASSWLNVHNALFPMINLTKSSDDMMSQYDELQEHGADPVAAAALLLFVAITVQQAPSDVTVRTMETIGDAVPFTRTVSDNVERFVIADDALAGTLEGIETSLLFLRLQLARACIKKLWLTLRRVIALAELIGLPRASTAMKTQPDLLRDATAQTTMSSPLIDRRTRKAEIWEAICATDRITSMLWSLPLATAKYSLPKRQLVDSQGRVDTQAYLYNLADIASRVLELDDIHSSRRSIEELYDAVIGSDQELRTLTSLTPEGWQRVHWPELSADALMQNLHQYLTVRTHLQLALKYNEGHQFTFNFITCFDACQDLSKRYVSIRPILPAGFFASRVIDLQAFTAAIFLLLSSHHTSDTFPQLNSVNVTNGLVEQVVRMMEFAASRVAGDFACQAASAIRSLSSLLQQTRTSESQEIILNLPLIGKIHVSRKSHPNPYPQQNRSGSVTNATHGAYPVAQATPFTSVEASSMNALSYSMEIPESYPFLTDETYGTEGWLTWTGWDGLQ